MVSFCGGGRMAQPTVKRKGINFPEICLSGNYIFIRIPGISEAVVGQISVSIYNNYGK